MRFREFKTQPSPFAMVAAAVLCAILPLGAFAAERYEFYNGVRMLGMGGAGVAVVNDETALMVNPAGLGKLRDYFITVADPELSAGSETQEVAGTEVLKMIRPQDALNTATEKPNKRMHLRAQMFPSIVVPNFGFGVFGKYEVNSELDSASNRFKYDYTNDYAFVFGFNFRLFDGIIKLGTSARLVNRVEVREDDINPASTNLTLEGLAAEGFGAGADTGIMISAPIVWLPTLAATYRDMGRTTYTLRDGLFMNTTTRPVSTPESVDVALALHPILGKRWRSTWTVEYRDALTYSEEKDQMRRLHGGFEINYADALFLRGGMNQRYWTAGLELAIINYQFQAASYGEEIGTDTNPREDRRYVIKFAFRF